MSTGLTTSVDAAQRHESLSLTSIPKSDTVNVALTVGSRLVHAASQAAVLVLIARLGGTQGAASFIWAMALTGPVFMFSNMNLRELIATETAVGHGFQNYWSLRLVTTTGGIGLLSVIVPLTVPAYEWSIIAIVAAVKALESIYDLILGAYHRGKRVNNAAISLVIRSIGGCLSLAIVLAATSNVTAGLAGLFLFQFLSTTVYDAPYVKQLLGQREPNDSKESLPILRIALPLGIVACLTSLSLNVPRYAVRELLDAQSLAAFGCCACFLQIFTLVGISTQLALSPRIASRNDQNRRLMNGMLWRLVLGVACIGTLIVISAHLWGAIVLSIIFGEQYAKFGPVLTWLMVGGVFAASKGFLATGLTATRSTLPQAAISAAQFACSAIGCVWLIPQYGVIAAAWVVAACNAVSLALHATQLRVAERKEIAT